MDLTCDKQAVVIVGFSLILLVSSLDSSTYEYTEWENWVPCSKKCGRGLSFRARGCARGECPTSELITYKTCNLQPCRDSEEEEITRNQQCAAFNTGYFRWAALHVADNLASCSLTCREQITGMIRQKGPKVLDGTLCGPNMLDICINGKCEPVGCDGQLKSTAKLDRCGVCNGDGQSCKLIRGAPFKLRSGKSQGTDVVYTFPQGSTNIMIRYRGSNYIGIRGTTLGSERGGLNQFPPASRAGTYIISGTRVRYTTERRGKKQITIQGPLQSEIQLTVMYVTPATELEYIYYNFTAGYIWKWLGWSDCSVSCNGGKKSTIISCVSVETGEVLEDSFCDQSKRPSEHVESCNNHVCPPRWHANPWTDCSTSCGQGVQQRIVTCAQDFPNGRTVSKVFQACQGPRPPSQRICNLQPCPHWLTGNWSECSVSCGDGITTRYIRCQNHQEVITTGCDMENRPDTQKTCSTRIPCHSSPRTVILEEEEDDDFFQLDTGAFSSGPEATAPHFVAGDFGDCSASCGEAVKNRSVNCEVSAGFSQLITILPDSNCTGPKPPTTVSCELPKCNTDDENNILTSDYGSGGIPQYMWHFNGHTECSLSCAGGYRESIVSCYDYISSEYVSDVFCNINNKLPIYRELCNDIPCPSTWQLVVYKDCSATCGGGVQEAHYLCMQKFGADHVRTVHDYMCKEPKPTSTRPCNEVPCEAEWVTGDWSNCSRECGSGLRRRMVYCHQRTVERQVIEVDPSLCPQNQKPSQIEDCNQIDCEPEWIVKEWSECSVTCGEGVQVRVILCVQQTASNNIEIVSTCDADKMPPRSEKCYLKKCVEILGNSTSVIQAKRMSKVRLQIGNTAKLYQGTTVLIRCPVVNFKKSNLLWTKNDVPITRHDGKFQILQDGTLKIWNIEKEDRGVYSCHAGDVSKDFNLLLHEDGELIARNHEIAWVKGQWSQCSVTCGNGIKSRNVTCVRTSAGVEESVQDQDCLNFGIDKPNTTQDCNKGRCANQWKTGAWGECSGKCNKPYIAYKLRRVWCENGKGVLTQGRNCNSSSKPKRLHPCQTMRCRPEWRKTKWSECSSSCGPYGFQTRKIHCVYGGTKGSAPTHFCNAKGQPNVIQQCNQQPCEPCKDLAHYCPLVKQLNVCNSENYQMQCCQSCST
ncbi:ADAMTS-like protein 1 [Anneissia japonica]|uniref:ADAMTS-like protein 1 n=1 Tax=Anneissia japonica TaxID=1529436 RepID=UPI001425712A|nr:ADAMTS-like protein 1 [Anneissia japonica]